MNNEQVRKAVLEEADAINAIRTAIVENYGSQSEYARQRGCSDAYVSACLTGAKSIPDDMLALAGIKRVTEYRLATSAAPERSEALESELLMNDPAHRATFTPGRSGKLADGNQCDGCQSGAPVRNGMHVDTATNGCYMVCQKSKYAPEADSSSAAPSEVCTHRYAHNPKDGHAVCEFCGEDFKDSAPAPTGESLSAAPGEHPEFQGELNAEELNCIKIGMDRLKAHESKVGASSVPTWRERAYDPGADQSCKITTLMQAEITDLRAALATTRQTEDGYAGYVRYTSDGALKECPCCCSLDVGGAHHTVHCQECGLTVSASGPLQNAIDKWNLRPPRSRQTEGGGLSAAIMALQRWDGAKFSHDFAERKLGDFIRRDDVLAAIAASTLAPKDPAAQGGVPAEMTPEMMRAVQVKSELGAYAAANLAGAYDLFREFWTVAMQAYLSGDDPAQGEPAAPVISSVHGPDDETLYA